MKTKLLLLLLLANFSIYAQQYTLIPDINFEKKLIDSNIDSGIADGQVLTSNISGLTYLDLYDSSISDLTGIEDFASLTNLDCRKNKLTSINLSKNIKLTDINIGENQLTDLNVEKNILLTSLDCQKNKLTNLDVSINTKLTLLNVMHNQISTLDLTNNLVLKKFDASSNKLASLNIDKNIELTNFDCANNLLTSIDVTQNTLLEYLYCHYNQITNLDIKNNTSLVYLMCHSNKLTNIDVSLHPQLEIFDCLDNQITSIDISNNPKLYELACENNQLTYLNLKNGNNIKFDLQYSNFINNPNLTCIQVDDVAYSNAEWSKKKDATATYSTTCTLGIKESVFDKVAIYPNPTKGELHINNILLDKATVYDSQGKLIKTTSFKTGNNDNTIHLAGLSKGIYYIYLESEGANTAKKVIIE
jgi:Leucine-rich repeat (LRR) protein